MIKISDKIYIDLQQHPMRRELLAELTYQNPDYYQKMNLGLSVWRVPKELQTYQINAAHTQMEILRGEFYKLKPFIYGIDVESSHPDHPITLQYINNDFELDAYQEGAVEAIKSRKQGVVHAVTSAGKSLIILKAICEMKQKALILVHRKILMQQFLDDIKKYVRDENGNPIEPGIIGAGKFTVGDITIAIDKTFAKHLGEFREAFGTVILDECHLAPANTIYGILNNLNSKNRFGFSGTLERKDGKQFLIFASFGPVIFTIGKDELLDLNRVVPVEVKVVESTAEIEMPEEISATQWYQLVEKRLSEDPKRMSEIVDLTYQLSQQGKTIVLSRLVQPCYRLKEMFIAKYGMADKVGVITGQDSKEALESYNAMKYSDMKVIFATVGCVSTGVSISDLQSMVLIAPIYTNKLLLHQIRGRLMRSAEGKTKAYLYFMYDPYVFPEHKLNRFLSIMRN